MDCQEYKEIIAAHVDVVLSPEEISDVEAHLGQCAKCTRIFHWETEATKILKERLPRVPAQANLREKILSLLPGSQTEKEPLFAWLFRAPVWVPVVLALLLVMVLPYFLWQEQESPDLFAQAVARYQNVTGGAGGSPPNHLSVAATARLLDLSPWGYRLLAKRSETVRGREGRMFVYQGSDRVYLLAQEFEGTDLSLPKDVQAAPTAGRDFVSFSQKGVNVVAWKEKDFVCMIASSLPKERLIFLAQQIATGT